MKTSYDPMVLQNKELTYQLDKFKNRLSEMKSLNKELTSSQTESNQKIEEMSSKI